MSEEDIYVRTCQECGHKQAMANPAGLHGKGWMEAKCRKCKSPSLNFGSYGYQRDAQGVLVKRPTDFDIDGDNEDL